MSEFGLSEHLDLIKEANEMSVHRLKPLRGFKVNRKRKKRKRKSRKKR